MSPQPDPIALTKQFVERKLVPWREFEGALVVGSRGHDEARPNSDVDMVLVFDPLDTRIVPGEFVWVPSDDTFHTIAVEAADVGAVQIDAERVSLAFLETGDLSEGYKHALAHALLLFDRGRVSEVLNERLAYPEQLRRSRVLEHRTWAEVHRNKASRPERWRNSLGWAGAMDLLVGALDEIVSLLHAYNGEFLPYLYRRLLSVSKLAWTPKTFVVLRDVLLTPTSPDLETRFAEGCHVLGLVLDEIDAQLKDMGWAENFGHVWAQRHLDLGFANTMQEWKRAHASLLRERSLGAG